MRNRKRSHLSSAWGAVPAVLLWLAPAAVLPQAAAAPKAVPVPEATPAPAPPIEPAALERMKAMSELLKGAGSFSFAARTARERPSVNGQMLDFFSASRVEVSRPNRIRVEAKGDLHDASLWYDGKTLTIYSEKTTFYGQAAAPATIDETLQMLMDRLQTPLPVAGFLFQDPYARMVDGVKTAFDAGTAQVDGVACRHLAFSEEDADWQLWIEEGAQPLPRRIAVTYKTVAGAPRVVTTLSDWNLTPTIPADKFVFVPPAGATKVDWKAGSK